MKLLTWVDHIPDWVLGLVGGAAVALLLALILSASGVGLTRKHSHPSYATEEREQTRVTKYGYSCGVQRWDDKTLSDANAPAVTSTPTRTNIPVIDALPAPPFTGTEDRTPPYETTLWKLTGTHVVAYKLENDSDIHLALKSPINGQTMIAEIPDPNCVSNSNARALIGQARANFVAQVGQPTGSFQYTDARVTLVGAGFFDAPHGQYDVAPNAAELHPVIAFHRW